MKALGAVAALCLGLILIAFSFNAASIETAAVQTGRPTLDEAQRATALGRERLIDGDIEGAKTAVKRALEIQEREIGVDRLEVAGSLARLGLLYAAQHNPNGAIGFYDRALAIKERRLGPDSAGVARTLDDLARLYIGLVDDDTAPAANRRSLRSAQNLLRRSLAIRERALGRTHPDVAVSLYNLARIKTLSRALIGGERPLDIRAFYLRALAIRENAFGPASAPVADGLVRLAEYDEGIGSGDFLSSAAKSVQRALEIQESLYGAGSRELIDNLTFLAGLYLTGHVGEKSDAAPLIERAVAIAENTYGAGDYWRAANIRRHAEQYRSALPSEAADSLVSRALVVEKGPASILKCPDTTKKNYSSVATIYDDQDRTDGVETLGGSLIDALAERKAFIWEPCGMKVSPV